MVDFYIKYICIRDNRVVVALEGFTEYLESHSSANKKNERDEDKFWRGRA